MTVNEIQNDNMATAQPDLLQKTPEAVKLRSLARVDDAAFGVRLASPHSQTSQVKNGCHQ